MSVRELVVLGTASQVPTRERAHNGYLLRFDGEGVLFDPGEGTQRQMIHAGVSASAITRVCITHFHGDHCLGFAGVVQRLALDRVTRPVPVAFPHSGAEYLERLTGAAIFHDTVDLRRQPIAAGEQDPAAAAMVRVDDDGPLRLFARRLEHSVDTLGWRLEEPGGRRMLPERLHALGVHGPDISRLQSAGRLELAGRTITLDEVSEHRAGQVVAFVMDTGLCDGARELAAGADMLVCEATFLDRDRDLARDYRHLTAAQAGAIAARAGVRTLVLSHFSQRYTDVEEFANEARAVFDGEVVAARDLDRIPLPVRRRQCR